MARVTIEDCLANIDNAFDIVTLASRRAKDLIDGSEPLVDCKDKPTVVALREIAAAEVGMDYFKTSSKEKIDNKLQDAITEEEIISEINQSYNVTNQENLTEVFEENEQETEEKQETEEALETEEKQETEEALETEEQQKAKDKEEG